AGWGRGMWRKGEGVEMRAINTIEGSSPRLQGAVKRLAEERAPETVAQLVLWHLGYGIDWPTRVQLSRPWANPSEVALARQFVDRQGEAESAGRVPDTGTLFYDVSAAEPAQERLGADVRKLLDTRTLLGPDAPT